MQSYVGITAFTNHDEVWAAYRAFPREMPRKLMIGVVATYKSMRHLPMKEIWARQTPPITVIPLLFGPDTNTLNLVHYSTEKGKEGFLAADMHRLTSAAGQCFHGFQINMPWPSVEQLYEYHETMATPCRIVLQIGKEASAIVSSIPGNIASMVTLYRELIDGILLDMSGGMGQALDPQWARQVLAAIKEKLPHLGLGVAGGLGPNSLNLLESLLPIFPDLSWDAQKLLRDKDNNLDLAACTTYLQKSAKMLSA